MLEEADVPDVTRFRSRAQALDRERAGRKAGLTPAFRGDTARADVEGALEEVDDRQARSLW